MAKITSLLWHIALVLVIGGCAGNKVQKQRTSVDIEGVGKAKIIAAAEDVLGEMYFSIDKSDIATGYVKTNPLRAPQLFEFWRSDSIGSFNTLEANLHTIRRTAELNVRPKNGKFCIECSVQIYRLNLPEREVSSSAQAYRMFSKSEPMLQKFKLTPEQTKGMRWVYLGKDAGLCTEILNRLENKLRQKELKYSTCR
ncbi:MAG: hypothetical protein JXB29_04975 [Sedimentisphaerales bacterium]|nr:hypothetical protein [Sedimentisphaerales bacterium]